MLEVSYHSTDMEGTMSDSDKKALAAAALKGLNTKGALSAKTSTGKYHDLNSCVPVVCAGYTQ